MGAQDISVGTVADRVWQIYKDQPEALLGVAAVLFLVQFLLVLLLSGAATILAVLVFWALSTLYQGMVVKLVQDVQDGRRDSSIPELLRSVEPIVLPLMGVSLIFAICVGIGFILLIVPGLFLLTIWAVVAPVMVVERPGVFASFGRSRELVRGRGWSVFGVIVVLYLAVVVVSILAGLISSGLGTFGHSAVQWAANVAIAPVTALTASVLYFTLHGGVQEPVVEGTPTTAPPLT